MNPQKKTTIKEREKDIFSKRERVDRTLDFLPVDRVAIMDHIENPGVVSLYTGKKIEGFNYSIEDVCDVVKKTMDMCRIHSGPRGTGIETREDGFIIKTDNWQEWVVKRPFDNLKGLKEYYLRGIERVKTEKFDLEKIRDDHKREFHKIQRLIGDTVIMDVMWAGFEGCWTSAGLELFSFFYYEEPEIISLWLQTSVESEIKKVPAIADKSLSPAVMVVSDLATKGGPIFSPDLLRKEWFPLLTRIVEAWHSHDIKVIYHTDGNFKILIDDFLKCGVDGFYCLEPSLGMDTVELKRKYPEVIWMAGIDGVDLMERGTTEEVRKEVRRQIEETDALNSGGLFIGVTSEITPMVKPENYKAMIEETKLICNKTFYP